MLNIAGSGVNLYSLYELSQKVKFDTFDCIIADSNFKNQANAKLIPENININFLHFKDVRPFIKTKLHENKNILYIITGSPIYFSATESLLSYLKSEIFGFNENMVNIIPAESSKDYLLRKLNILDNEVTSLSIHGKIQECPDLSRFLSSKYTFVLCDEHSIHKIVNATEYLKQDLTFYLGSKLGAQEESIKEVNIFEIAKQLSSEDIKNTLCPYVLLIKRNYDLTYGFTNNNEFQTTEGMLTKTDKRAFSIQPLELSPNMVLWDVGAGSGSISIDSYKLFKTRTFLFEKNEVQCDFIRKNLKFHKIAGTKLYSGNVLDNYKNAPKPDRIFIGGGGEHVLKEIETLYDQLNFKGLIIANIVSLENLSSAIETLKYRNINYEIRSIDITNYTKISEKVNLSIGKPERTLFQLIIKK